ncbi:MAG: hypothetical protein FJ009_10325 [Chloroflexi bacterium]|nr:hypothetical protein [Chloroflexota bacterium]
MTDPIGVWVGAILTLLVFSYLLGDTPLFRVAQAIFVGVAIGYAISAAVYLILLPLLFDPLIINPVMNSYLVIPLILGLLLLLKLRTAWAPVGNLSIAFLFGVGSALALGGALDGTLLPQLSAIVVPLDSLENVLLVAGTLGALLSFRFIQPQSGRFGARVVETVARGWGAFGRWFVMIALGALFASVAVSRISLLVNRVYFLLHDWLQIVK